jgi:hypothetical protein
MFDFVPNLSLISTKGKPVPMNLSSSQVPVSKETYYTNRERYLQGTLKLNHDPFLNPTAEKEVQIKPEDSPFFSYFAETPYIVNAPYRKDDTLLLDKLKEPGTAVVYGEAGSGKTTLKYMLEWLCREIPERTLIVSYNLGKGEPLNPDINARWNKLAEAIAIDLFIQALEQFDTVRPDKDPAFIRAFGLYWQQHIPHFQRTIDVRLAQYRLDEARSKQKQADALKKQAARKRAPHTQATEPGVFVGVSGDISKWWWVWDRPGVRYTSLSPDMQLFLRDVLTVKDENAAKKSGRDAVIQGLELVNYLNYEQMFLVIDVVGATNEEDLDIEALLDFLVQLDTLGFPVEYKLFLPVAFETAVTRFFAAKGLTPPRFSAIIKWHNPEAFNKLISNRLQRASKWIRKLDTFMNPEVAAQFNNIIEEDGRTPRQLLQTISHLIDAHARRAAEHYEITPEDWEQMEQDWSGWG